MEKDPYIRETTKITEILDSFGKLRFKVFLADMLDYDDVQHCDSKYRITVESFCYGQQPTVILIEFKTGFDAAHDFYCKCIQQYKHLAIAETRHFQDISIYADKIDYHKIDPDCCKSCKWSGKAHEFCQCHEKALKLVCKNHKIFELTPCQKTVDIEPVVNPYGICKHFSRKCC